MKSLLSILVAIIVVSFISCGYNTPAPPIDNDSIPNAENLIDSMVNAGDSIVATDSTATAK